MSSGDHPYFNLQTPSPQSLYSQEKFGYIEIDAGVGATGLSLYGKLNLHGTNRIEGDGISADSCSFVPSFSFNGSHINISGTRSNITGGMSFVNLNLNASNSINKFTNVIPTSGNASYIYGGLYITPVTNTENQTCQALCVMYP